MTLIATFHSHYDAIRFRRELTAAGLPCRLRPVPRAVSSSCGTCALLEAEPAAVPRGDIEALYEQRDGSWVRV